LLISQRSKKTMSIHVNHLTKIYGEQAALNEISFQVHPGEVVGFLGPNGAGKSTTMKILTGYIPQTDGEASVNGFDVNKNAMDVKRSVGYLPENNPLYGDMYVREYLNYSAAMHRVSSEKKLRINEMISITGLENEQHKKIGSLSKGYRQRVGLAQALLHNPPVLILDEPTSGLDPNQLVEIRELIKDLGKEKTVFLSTHIMQEVLAICTRVIIINKGKIVADDSIEKLQTTSLENIVRVKFSHTVSPHSFKNIEAVKKIETINENEFRLSGDANLNERVFQFAVDNHFTIVSLQEEKQNLEEVFRELTKENAN
jgi:ABC-2 type transport system ATP-binding protein